MRVEHPHALEEVSEPVISWQALGRLHLPAGTLDSLPDWGVGKLVSHGTLDPACAGSSPAAPARSTEPGSP